MSRTTTIKRRAKTVPAIIAAIIFGIPALILSIPVFSIIDVLRGKPKLPLVRLGWYGVHYLLWEAFALVSAPTLWIVSGCGVRLYSHEMLRRHRAIQVRWAQSLFNNAETMLGVCLEVDHPELVSDGPLIMLARHASIVDTLLPIQLAQLNGLDVRYVMKQELQLDPCLDFYAGRIPNYFVDRHQTNSGIEAQNIRHLAEGTGDNEMCIIFPEGTRFTAAKRSSIQQKLEAEQPERGAFFADKLSTLPPRRGGALAILDGLPDADVVIMAYTGLEALVGAREVLRALPFEEPVEISLRRIARSDIPTDPEDQATWLDEQWALVDQWVSEAHKRRGQ